MGYIGEIDQAIINYVEQLPSELSPIMRLITILGSPEACILILLVIIAYCYIRKARRFSLAALVILFAMPIAPLLKELVRRVRPDSEYVRSMIFQTYSFPSGHAYSSFLVFGFLAFLAWRYAHTAWKYTAIFGLVVLIFLVGVSRIYLGAHFPSDVLGGWALAAIILFLTKKVGFRYKK